MGNYIRALSEHIQLVAGSDTWIEGAALQQLETTAKLDQMRAVVGLPDLHPGRGYPIGAAFFSVNKIYPALVGGDIGCGMSLWQTGIELSKFKINRIEKQLKSIDSPLTADKAKELLPDYMHGAPGTIGGGNHFAEIQQIDEVYDTSSFSALHLAEDQIQLLVHSGSRGLGGKILGQHLTDFGHGGLIEGEENFDNYIKQHNHALAYAKENRELIALRLLELLRTQGMPVIDLWHNSVTPAEFNGIKGWLHRKGAAPADQGAVVIPGSRGDYSYIVKPTLSEQSALALHSVAHGAGRKWMRSECKGRLKRFNSDQLKRSSLGSRLICDAQSLVFEEAPQAYKSIDTVIEALEGANLVTKIARLKPLVTYKTRTEEN